MTITRVRQRQLPLWKAAADAAALQMRYGRISRSLAMNRDGS